MPPLPRPALLVVLVLIALAGAMPARAEAPCHEAPVLSETGAVCEAAPEAVPCRSRPSDGPASSHACCARGHTPAPPSPAPPVPGAPAAASVAPAVQATVQAGPAPLAPAGPPPGPPCGRPVLFGQLLN